MSMKTTALSQYTGKIFESAMASLDQVHHSLDMSAVNRAVDLLTQAKNRLFRPRLPQRRSLTTR